MFGHVVTVSPEMSVDGVDPLVAIDFVNYVRSGRKFWKFIFRVLEKF